MDITPEDLTSLRLSQQMCHEHYLRMEALRDSGVPNLDYAVDTAWDEYSKAWDKYAEADAGWVSI